MLLAGLIELRQHIRESPGCMGGEGLSKEEMDRALKAEIKRQRDRIFERKNREKRKETQRAVYRRNEEQERERKRVKYWENVEEERAKKRDNKRRPRQGEGHYGPIFR